MPNTYDSASYNENSTDSSTKRSLSGATAPINALPNEILSEIMFFVLYGGESLEDMYTIPSVICQTSPRWAEVAKQTHHLWHIVIVDNSQSLDHVPVRLQRSGDLTLVIMITEDSSDYNWIARNAIERLLPASERWGTLIIKTASATSYLDRMSTTFPRLTGLSMESVLPYSSRICVDLFAPHLEIFQLINISMFWSPSTTKFSNLTDFRMSGYADPIHIDQLLDNIGHSPHLTSLNLSEFRSYSISSGEFDSLMQRVISLPKLAELTLAGIYMYEVCIIMSVLRTPTLKNLVLSIVKSGIAAVPESFNIQRLHVDYPSLENLEWRKSDIDVSDAVHIMEQLPPLHTLQFVGVYTHLPDVPASRHISRIFEAVFSHPSLQQMTSKLCHLHSQGIPISIVFSVMTELLHQREHAPTLFISPRDLNGGFEDNKDIACLKQIAERLGRQMLIEQVDLE